MAEMGRYCKAYQLGRLREFEGWDEAPTEDGADRDADSIVYLQESYAVTDGIFKDEGIVCDRVTGEWKEFCTTKLGFEPPTPEPSPTDLSDAPVSGDEQDPTAS